MLFRSLDVAFLGLVLPYLPQPARVFEEVARTTKVAGRLVVLDMVTHDRGEFRDEFGHMWLGFSQAQIFDWMGQAGWRPENWVPLHLDHEAKGTPVFVATAKRLPNGS